MPGLDRDFPRTPPFLISLLMAAKIGGSGLRRSYCLSLYPGSKAVAASDCFAYEVARFTPPSLRPP
jgi:hypothetical protein